MRIGLISIGFLMLNLNFLPVSISLTIIMLGLIYAYEDKKDNEILYLIIVDILVIMFSFLEIPLLFLFIKTIYVVYLLLFIEKNVNDEVSRRRLHKTIITYALLHVFNIIPFFGFLSIVLFFITVSIFRQLLKIRKGELKEDKPQLIMHQIPVAISVIVIVMSMVIIVFSRQYFVDYTYNKASNITVYEVISEKIKIRYFATQTVHYRLTNSWRGGSKPWIVCDEELKGETLSVVVNGRTVAKGLLEFDGSKNIYNQQSSFDISSMGLDTQTSCIIKVDENEYKGVIQKVEPSEYGYKDKNIQIDHCYIQEGYALSLPRIQVTGKDKAIRSVTVYDKSDEIIANFVYEDRDHNSSDNKSVYLENITSSDGIGVAPYKVKIGFINQDKSIEKLDFKEYMLVKL